MTSPPTLGVSLPSLVEYGGHKDISCCSKRMKDGPGEHRSVNKTTGGLVVKMSSYMHIDRLGMNICCMGYQKMQKPTTPKRCLT